MNRTREIKLIFKGMRQSLIGLVFLLVWFGNSYAGERILIDSKNQYGGKTFYSDLEKRTLKYYEYYDVGDNRVAEEYVFTEDYPILSRIRRQQFFYTQGKKIREVFEYTAKYTSRTLLTKTINYYDRISGEKRMAENHFSHSHLGYNLIYYEGRQKKRIEWFYPENKRGICKKIFFYDTAGQEQKNIAYFTRSFIENNGYYKKVVLKGKSSGKYHRKKEEVFYYTDHFSEQNSDLVRKVIKYRYLPNQKVEKKSYYFDSFNSELMHLKIQDGF